MTTSLKRIGYFRELGHGDKEGPSIRACVCSDLHLDEDRIINYLTTAIVLSIVLGISRDYFDLSTIIGAPRNMTDGVYLWPSDLTHYIKNYHCRIPDDFVDHMRSRGWEPPGSKDIDMEALLPQ